MEPTAAPTPSDAPADVPADDPPTPPPPAPVVEVEDRQPSSRRGVSVPALLAIAVVVAALTAAFVTIWSLNSDLDAQESLVADLREEVDALEADVRVNEQAVADAAARADEVEARADDIEERAAELEDASVVGSASGDVVDSGDAIVVDTTGALPPFPGNGQPDAAIGVPLPDVSGSDHLTGDEVTLADGSPTMIMLWAHWCPHCQDELPEVEQLYADGVFADAGIELVTIATFEDPERGNPFEDYVEEFSFPVIRDDRTRAALLGMSGVPSWIVVDGDGAVLGRFSGRLGTDTLRNVIDQVAAET